MAAEMFGKPRGSSAEYDGEVISERFVTNPGKVGDEIKVAPEIVAGDLQERIRRVTGADAACHNALVRDMDFSTTVNDTAVFESALLSKGETVVASIQCVAIRGMPNADPEREFTGKGVLVLTELAGKNRVHFAMHESCASFEAAEVWTEQVSGCLCCKRRSHTVSADYGSRHSQALTFTTLPISGNLFDVYGSMVDTAELDVHFGGSSARPGGKCCQGGCCPCAFCCCPLLVCCMTCCKGREKQEGIWEKQTALKPKLQRMLESSLEEVQMATYKFPDIAPISDKEERKQKIEKVHTVNFLYPATGQGLVACEVFASPEEPAVRVARFTASLGALSALEAAAPRQKQMGDGPEEVAGAGFGNGKAAGKMAFRKRSKRRMCLNVCCAECVFCCPGLVSRC